jgi:hypothetical protein
MARYLFSTMILGVISVATPVRAANRPHARTDSQSTLVWTNDDLDNLHDRGLISIVGRMNEERSKSASSSQPYVKTHDPQWYAEQAAGLRDGLGQRKAQLAGYRQAIEDAKSLKTTTGGINLEEGNIGITLEAGIEILQQRVSETQSELDALEDLARRNDIPPCALRGQ